MDIDPIQEDWEPLSPTEFDHRYPQYKSLINLEWACRQRKTNGMLEDGSVIEVPFGSRTRCRVIPALLAQRLTGKQAIKPHADLMLEKLNQTNDRLATLESRMAALMSIIEASYGNR